jgi:hypothetical protein
MFDTLLPRQLDGAYRGHKLAPWLLIVIVSVKIAQSLAVLFAAYEVVSSAEGLPLDTYSPGAAQAVVFAFAGWKVERLLIALLCLLVLDRYRAMIPLMFAMFLLQDSGRRLVAHFFPMTTIGTAPVLIVNLVLLGLAVVGLLLSLWKQDARRNENAAQRAA